MRPLDDLTVVERGAGIGLRHAGRLLAALGARVVRPEGAGPVPPGHEGAAGAAFAAWLDAGKETGPAPATPDLRLLEDAAEAPAGALVARMLGMGAEGPRAGWRLTDAVAAAMAGQVHAFGPVEGPPALPSGHGPQITAAAALCIAALAGLIGRRRGAGPEEVSVSVFEAALCLAETVPMVFELEGRPPGRRGVNRYYPTYPATCWQAADGWIGVTALTPPQWRALCEIAGLAELGSEPAFATSELRTMAADIVDAAFVPRIRARPVAHWVSEGQVRRVPIVAAPRPGDLPDHPHWRARGSFEPLAAAGDLPAPRAPWRLSAGRAGPARDGAATPGLPLAGLGVLDFSKGWSGPLATRWLGGLGADVLKVESPANLDWWRGWNGLGAGDPPPEEMRREWVGMNVDKRGLRLDLADPDDVAAALRLAGACDVVIENFAAGVMERLGLGPAALQAAAPGVTTVSMALFGAEGPEAGVRGYGSTNEQASGLVWMNGADDWPPALCHVALGDAVAGLYAAVVALAGVWGRPRHGGMQVDLAQVEALFQIAAPGILFERAEGRPVPRHPARRPGHVGTWVVRAAGEDAWLVVDAPTEVEAAALRAALGLAPGAGIEGPLAAWAAGRDADTGAEALQAAGVPAGPARPPNLLDRDPQLRAAGIWTRGERRHTGPHLLARLPVRLDGRRPEIRRMAPLVGEHTDEILAQFVQPEPMETP